MEKKCVLEHYKFCDVHSMLMGTDESTAVKLQSSSFHKTIFFVTLHGACLLVVLGGILE